MKLDLKAWISKVTTLLQSLSYTNSETVYLDYCKVKRVGNVVNVWGQSTGGWSTTAGQYRALTTLPTWARPSHEVVDTVEAYGNQQYQISIQITTSGTVNFYCGDATSWWRYNVTYIVGG